MSKNIKSLFLVLFATLLLAGCFDSSPGALKGTWASNGVLPMRIAFREGETESMGLIEKVTYHFDGQSVLVTYTEGMAKGTSARFVLNGPAFMQGFGSTFHKISD